MPGSSKVVVFGNGTYYVVTAAGELVGTWDTYAEVLREIPSRRRAS
jgi:hypothetical protein